MSTLKKIALSTSVISDLKNNVSKALISTNKLVSSSAVENRNSDLFENYMDQYSKDIVSLKELREAAMNLFDICNISLYNIAGREVYNHVTLVNPEDLEGIDWEDEK